MPEVVRTELEVRWGECDAAGIVYHPNYIDWFSIARMHFLGENGVSYMKAFQDKGIVLVVLDVGCRFKKTLRAEDRVIVEARLALLTKTRLRMVYQVIDENGTLCAEGYTEHAYVDVHNKAVNIAKREPALWAQLASFQTLIV